MWIGVDFSGDHTKWRPHCGNSNVWVARVANLSSGLHLSSILAVQCLPDRGSDHPFVHLANVLARGDYEAAAIDAPFSVPKQFMADDHASLLKCVAGIPCGRRPFPEAATFVNAVAVQPYPLDPKKPLRASEEHWQSLGVNTRSTMWAGPRGGAAFASACIKLLSLARRPIWPWTKPDVGGIIVEAFPAAQLKNWGLKHDGYANQTDEHYQARRTILDYIGHRLRITKEQDELLVRNPDALDAVICTFAAMAVTSGDIGHETEDSATKEGWICVQKAHR